MIYPPQHPPKINNSEDSIINAYYALEHVIGIIFPNNTANNNIPFENSIFLSRLQKAINGRLDLKFLDVGCGLGIKGYLANELGCHSFGVEINQHYAEIACKMGNEVILCNALDYNDYNKYDIIYWYRPIDNEELEAKLEEKIFSYSAPILFPAIELCFQNWKQTKYNKVDDFFLHENFGYKL